VGMKLVEGIPIIFGKGNGCNRLKRFRNQEVKNLQKIKYYLFPPYFFIIKQVQFPYLFSRKP
jgi:hypothetical protein